VVLKKQTKRKQTVTNVLWEEPTQSGGAPAQATVADLRNDGGFCGETTTGRSLVGSPVVPFRNDAKKEKKATLPRAG